MSAADEFRFSAENRRGSGARLSGANAQVLVSSQPMSDERVAELIEELEKQLEVELAIRAGAENLLKISKKGDKAAVTRKLEESSLKVEKIREKIAVLNGRSITRHGCAHTISDLVDMIAETKMTKERMQERIAWVTDKIAIETKVKVGAENLAKVYGHGLGDKKALSNLYTKLVDSNTKINLLKVALQKYQIGLGVPVTDVVIDTKAEKQAQGEQHWKRVNVTGRLKVRVLGTKHLSPPHKKLDARCIIKVDAEAAARTSVKSKTSSPVWNEEFDLTLKSAGDIEFQIYDKNELFALHFLDLSMLSNMPPGEEHVLELEPRGELTVVLTFVAVTRKDKMFYRRGAVKQARLPMTMIRLLGFKSSVEMANTLQKEQTRRIRTMRQQNRGAAAAGGSFGASAAQAEVLDEDERVRSALARKSRLDDFVLLRVLGKGNFGKVMLVEEKSTKNLYAIKVLKKEFVVENDEVESVKTEKRVFQTANKLRHPFLVKLHSSFQSHDRLFFVMEYVSGGDLMMHIQRQVFSEARARLYAAEVLLALEYLHSNNIIYRDLKLDNIMMDLDGHIKIADYGLCKENMAHGSTTNTFCGTPEFMAPEVRMFAVCILMASRAYSGQILLEKDYDRSVDWWAFGVLIYEMILAQSPFKGDEEEEIFEAILESEVYYPPRLAPEAADIIRRLLTRDPAKRLGGGGRDAAEIKEHAFWAGLDFDAVLRREVEVTYKPTLANARDTSNFDVEFTREAPRLTPMESTLTADDQEDFKGFSYVADWVTDDETAI